MDIREIIKKLNQDHILGSEIIEYKPLTGGTVSQLFLLQTKDGYQYVVKANNPKVTQSEANFLKSYGDLKLLPDLHFVEQSNQFLVYSFIEGSTKYVRNNKAELLVRLVQDLINHYKTVPEMNGWGWADEPTDSWHSYLMNRTIDAKKVLNSYLDNDDHDFVFDLVQKVEDSKIEPYLLHGDLGVHNLIFNNGQLTGVIDPTPVIGDPLYDLIYAFCSSPDDLTKQTIDAAASVLNIEDNRVNSTVYENVIIGLYHRLAACIKHHPNDLKEYLNAWNYWRNIIEIGEDSLTEWKPNKFQTQDRYDLAHEILHELKNKYQDDLIAVVIEGSTAKGTDCPESDLELRVVINGRDRGWYPFFYKGMFTGISFNSLEKIYSKSTNIDYEWCVKGDALFTCKILHDPTDLYGTLREKAKAAVEQADFDCLIKDALADMYEHVYKIYTISENDGITAAHEARQVAYWATMCVGLKNRYKFLSSRSMYHESFKLESLPNDFEQYMKGLLSLNTDVQRLKRDVGDLWVSTYRWAETNGIKLDENDLSFL